MRPMTPRRMLPCALLLLAACAPPGGADATAGSVSRLTSVARFGRGMAAYPVTFRFAYSKTLGTVCDSSCEKAFTRDMGTLAGVDFSHAGGLMAYGVSASGSDWQTWRVRDVASGSPK